MNLELILLYKDLYNCLENLRKSQIKNEMEKIKEIELEKIKINQKYNKKIENKERNNTKNKKIEIKEIKINKENKENKENKDINNLQNILYGMNKKIRTRNKNQGLEDENQNELTFIPFIHNINNLSFKKEVKNQNKSTSNEVPNYSKIYYNNKNKKKE